MEDFIKHAMDPWHDELIISSYSKYLDKRKTSKIIKFLEYGKNKIGGIVIWEYIWER